MTDQFSKAVAFGEMVLQHFVHDGKKRAFEIEPSEIKFILLCSALSGADEKGSFVQCADGALIKLLSSAKTDRGAFNLARRILASRLIRGEPLPDEARKYAGLYIAGLIDPPKKQRAAKTFAINLMLYWAAKRIENEFGLTLTRGDDTASISACDAVVVALENIGHRTSFRAIKDLCYHDSSKKMRQEANQYLELMNKVGAENPEMQAYWQSQAPWTL